MHTDLPHRLHRPPCLTKREIYIDRTYKSILDRTAKRASERASKSSSLFRQLGCNGASNERTEGWRKHRSSKTICQHPRWPGLSDLPPFCRQRPRPFLHSACSGLRVEFEDDWILSLPLFGQADVDAPRARAEVPCACPRLCTVRFHEDNSRFNPHNGPMGHGPCVASIGIRR